MMSKALTPETRGSARVTLGVLALDAALLLAFVGWQKLPAGLAGPSALRAALALAAAAGLALLGIALLVLAWRRGARRTVQLAAAANAVGLVLAGLVAEAALRIVAVPDAAGGVRIGNAVLAPTWDELRARNAKLIAGHANNDDGWFGYVVPDPELGWTVGPSRATPDGMYASSAEGVRSAQPGVAFAARRPPLRIALVGDSYTFAKEGPFEDSWGAMLEEALGPDTQVLNFGVDGYGIDQAWLRYARDVRPWKPDLVLFGFIQHDMYRTAAVYPFIGFGWDYPFAKPRFTLADGQLTLLNMPLPDAQGIAATPDVAALPFVNWDLGYRGTDWRWRTGSPPLLGRLAGVALPRWTRDAPEVSPASVTAVSAALLAQFLRTAAAEGTPARILYFPSKGAGDFGRTVRADSRIAHRMLAEYRIPHVDLTGCVAPVGEGRRYLPGRSHYTRAANAAVAGCVEVLVREMAPGGVSPGVAGNGTETTAREGTGAGGGT